VPSDTIHVWRVPLDVAASFVDRSYQTLSEDERERAAAISLESARAQFVVSRAVLRTILSRYVGTPPGELRFDYGPFGKPVLVPDREEVWKPVHFNLSHTKGLALVAVTNREIGVDVECVDSRRLPDPLQVAEQYLSADDCAVLGQLPAHLRRTAFLTIWTRKEAFAKAVGMGLSIPLDRIPVPPPTRDGSVDMVTAVRGQDDQRQWAVMALDPGPGYVGAIVTEGLPAHLEQWLWEDTYIRQPA
jgi:4'-phosphopantetheinyl transferase